MCLALFSEHPESSNLGRSHVGSPERPPAVEILNREMAQFYVHTHDSADPHLQASAANAFLARLVELTSQGIPLDFLTGEHPQPPLNIPGNFWQNTKANLLSEEEESDFPRWVPGLRIPRFDESPRLPVISRSGNFSF